MDFGRAELRRRVAHTREVQALMRRSGPANFQHFALPPPFALDQQVALALCNRRAQHEGVNQDQAVVEERGVADPCGRSFSRLAEGPVGGFFGLFLSRIPMKIRLVYRS